MTILKGLLIGVLISIPLGPMALICVQRSLIKGWKSGFASGLGIATADTIFAAISFLGIGFLISYVEKHEDIFHLLTGVVVVAVGISMFKSKLWKSFRKKKLASTSMFKDYLSMFFYTLLNPGSILIVATLLTLFKITSDSHYNLYIIIPAVFLGASFWWFSLSAITYSFRNKFNIRNIVFINRLISYIITGAGVYLTLYSVLSIFF